MPKSKYKNKKGKKKSAQGYGSKGHVAKNSAPRHNYKYEKASVS